MAKEIKFTLEDDVNDYVKKQLESLGLVKNKDYTVETAMSSTLKEALRGSAKTKNKKNFGVPDLHIEKYGIPVIIEDKLGTKKLINKIKGEISDTDKAISNFAVNGAIHYATNIIASGVADYNEVIAIGVAGDSDKNMEIDVYYVYGSAFKTVKHMKKFTTLDFLENEVSFKEFYTEAILTEEEKHNILVKSRADFQKHAKNLNKLMNNHNISAPQRVLYVSGMLLSMQDVTDSKGNVVAYGVVPDELQGSEVLHYKDSTVILNHIDSFLRTKNIPSDKVELMLSSFDVIKRTGQRDVPVENDKLVTKLLQEKASCNKQIFSYIFHYVYSHLGNVSGHLDILGELYSEFLKYAMGDGKELGIVLTPPYVTALMCELIGVDKDSKVMDLTTGSAGFLISAMEHMIQDANTTYGRGTSKAKEKIRQIKESQLLGVEMNSEMYTLAATNMILRGDGSSNIINSDAFLVDDQVYEDFKPTHLLLNPPFSYSENGMPFLELGLSYMKEGGMAAIIVQDSVGTGKAIETNKKILKNHTLVANIKMPEDLFEPMAGVQTSIYIVRAGVPHNFEEKVKFIDFSEDGYKRTKRGTTEVANPKNRYMEIKQMYFSGKEEGIEYTELSPKDCLVEDVITPSGDGWNFDTHKKYETTPTAEDFEATISDLLHWELFEALERGAF